MSQNDKKFEVVYPTSWDRLMRPSFEVADKDILNPNVAAPKVPLMDGEFLTENSEYKLIRAVYPLAPSWRLAAYVAGTLTVTIDPAVDSAVEPDETVEVTLTNPSGAALGLVTTHASLDGLREYQDHPGGKYIAHLMGDELFSDGDDEGP